MTFNAYWAKLVALNPMLASGETTIKLPVRSFMRELEKAYKAGVANAASTSPGIFDQIFGSRM